MVGTATQLRICFFENERWLDRQKPFVGGRDVARSAKNDFLPIGAAFEMNDGGGLMKRLVGVAWVAGKDWCGKSVFWGLLVGVG